MKSFQGVAFSRPNHKMILAYPNRLRKKAPVKVNLSGLVLFFISNALILANSGLNLRWGGRAAMRSPAEKNIEESGFIRVRIPSPPCLIPI